MSSDPESLARPLKSESSKRTAEATAKPQDSSEAAYRIRTEPSVPAQDVSGETTADYVTKAASLLRGDETRTDRSQSGRSLPTTFGRYQILRQIGEGGMGAVYLAHDSKLDRQVALKVPRFDANSTEAIRRFEQEAKAAATLRHPNICPIYDVGEFQGVHFIAMAYVEGQSLRDVVRSGKSLGQSQIAKLVRGVALGMHEAHTRQIVHRDLKLDNIMLDRTHGPVIMDFGLARCENGADLKLTATGAILGTPSYMAPEQVNGDNELVGPGTDIYSLGVILYELLTGRLPFEGKSLAAVFNGILNSDPVAPSKRRAGVDPRLEAICLKAMSKRIASRYRSMAQFAADLEGKVRAAPAAAKGRSSDREAVGTNGNAWQRLQTVVRERKKLAIGVSSGLAAVLIIVAVVAGIRSGRNGAPKHNANPPVSGNQPVTPVAPKVEFELPRDVSSWSVKEFRQAIREDVPELITALEALPRNSNFPKTDAGAESLRTMLRTLPEFRKELPEFGSPKWKARAARPAPANSGMAGPSQNYRDICKPLVDAVFKNQSPTAAGLLRQLAARKFDFQNRDRRNAASVGEWQSVAAEFARAHLKPSRNAARWTDNDFDDAILIVHDDLQKAINQRQWGNTDADAKRLLELLGRYVDVVTQPGANAVGPGNFPPRGPAGGSGRGGFSGGGPIPRGGEDGTKVQTVVGAFLSALGKNRSKTAVEAMRRMVLGTEFDGKRRFPASFGLDRIATGHVLRIFVREHIANPPTADLLIRCLTDQPNPARGPDSSLKPDELRSTLVGELKAFATAAFRSRLADIYVDRKSALSEKGSKAIWSIIAEPHIDNLAALATVYAHGRIPAIITGDRRQAQVIVNAETATGIYESCFLKYSRYAFHRLAGINAGEPDVSAEVEQLGLKAAVALGGRFGKPGQNAMNRRRRMGQAPRQPVVIPEPQRQKKWIGDEYQQVMAVLWQPAFVAAVAKRQSDVLKSGSRDPEVHSLRALLASIPIPTARASFRDEFVDSQRSDGPHRFVSPAWAPKKAPFAALDSCAFGKDWLDPGLLCSLKQSCQREKFNEAKPGGGKKKAKPKAKSLKNYWYVAVQSYLQESLFPRCLERAVAAKKSGITPGAAAKKLPFLLHPRSEVVAEWRFDGPDATTRKLIGDRIPFRVHFVQVQVKSKDPNDRVRMRDCAQHYWSGLDAWKAINQWKPLQKLTDKAPKLRWVDFAGTGPDGTAVSVDVFVEQKTADIIETTILIVEVPKPEP